MNLNKNQSYDTQELHDLLPEGYAVSGHGESKLTVHGDVTPAIQTIIEAHINAMTLDERKADIARIENENAIIAKADAHIEAVYSPKKQRKLMSIAVELIDKKTIRGAAHTPEEATMLQSIRDTNTWITAVRVIENAAIINGTTADEVTYG